MIEVEFKTPTEKNGYKLFSEELENNPNVIFHGTSEDCAKSIIDNGFKPIKNLSSSSFCKTSSYPLKIACEKRENGRRGAVLAAKIDSLDVSGIRSDGDVFYLDDRNNIKPGIVAVCYIPNEYNHI